MDILYVHPAKQEVDARYDKFISCSPYPYIPVGVIGLVNRLRSNGRSVQALNLPVELLLEPTLDFRSWLREQSAPRVVLVDLHWYEHCYGALEVARAVKVVWPDVPVVVGGLTATQFADEIVRDYPYVDYVVRGDAEVPLGLLVDHCCCGGGLSELAAIPNLVYRQNGQVNRNPLTFTAGPDDLDALDFVSIDWLQHWESYAAFQYSGSGEVDFRQVRFQGHWLSVGRGCTFNCIYCGGCQRAHRELAGREGFVLRSPERVVQDVKRLADRGVHQVAFSLDLATFEPAWWQALFGLMRERGLRIGLYNESFQLPSDEFIEAFAGVADPAHTELAISPLSGSEKVRKRNGKFFSNARLLRVLRTLEHHRLPVFVYFSLNLPGETPRTLKDTLRLAENVGRAYPAELLRMLNTCHTLDPVSPMSKPTQELKSLGIQVHYQTFQDYYAYCRGTGWQPRSVTRGQHRGFEIQGRPNEVVEQMARRWDQFAEKQVFRCYPVPRGW